MNIWEFIENFFHLLTFSFLSFHNLSFSGIKMNLRHDKKTYLNTNRIFSRFLFVLCRLKINFHAQMNFLSLSSTFYVFTHHFTPCGSCCADQILKLATGLVDMLLELRHHVVESFRIQSLERIYGRIGELCVRTLSWRDVHLERCSAEETLSSKDTLSRRDAQPERRSAGETLS